MAEISQEELNERVAILRKFRSLLEQQREKFREYLKVESLFSVAYFVVSNATEWIGTP